MLIAGLVCTRDTEGMSEGNEMMAPEFTFPCNADKTPRMKEWQHGAFQNMVWRRAPLVAALTGPRNGFDVLDIDPKAIGWYVANFGRIPQTRRHETRRFVHLLFKHSPGLRNSRDKIAEGIDVRADGGYAIWWPREGFAVEDRPLAEWPDWLLAEAMSACGGGKRSEVTDGLGAYPRQRSGGDRARAHDAREVANLTEALRLLDPVEWRDTWDEWWALLGACKAAGISREDFVVWSMGDPKYADRREEIERIWEAARGEHPGALYAALAERGIKVPQGTPTPHDSLLSRVQPKPASNRSGKSAPSGKSGGFHHLDRIEGLRAAVRRDQREPVLFSYSCLYAEILFEQGTTSAKAFEVAQGLLEGDCPDLIREIGRDAVQRSIRRGFAHVEHKLMGERE